MACVLHNACIVDGVKVSVMSAIDIMVESLKMRIAPEVYMRIVQNRKASEKHYRRIEEYAPKTGIVRLLRLTEK